MTICRAQRSCVILEDVLGHSLEGIGVLLELSVPAVKAALHRGRVRLRELAAEPQAAPPMPASSPAGGRCLMDNRNSVYTARNENPQGPAAAD